MSRDVTIQLLDIVDAGYPKQMLEKEPVLLRRSEIVRQVKNGSVNITNETQRLAISKTSEVHNSDIGMLTANNVMQIATVKDVQTVYDKVVDVSQGFIDVTVKYGLYFWIDGTAPYYTHPGGYPSGTVFNVGDLALNVYNEGGILLEREWYEDAGDRNGLTGSNTLNGDQFPLYRYDGTGWRPVVLDTSNELRKYRIKVQHDYAYLVHLNNEWDFTKIPSIVKSHTENYYELIYYPNSPSAGITRSARMPKLSESFFFMKAVAEALSKLDCGNTSSI